MTLKKQLKPAVDSSTKEAVPSSFGKRRLIKAILMASTLSSATAALWGNEASACGELGIGEFTAVSKRCSTMETCQNSLKTILDKGVNSQIEREFLKKYSTDLNKSVDTVFINVLEKSKAKTKSLKLIREFDPPTWAEELSDPDLDKSKIAIIRESAKGMLEDLEEKPMDWRGGLGKSRADMLGQLAQWTVDLANLKIAQLEALEKYDWFVRSGETLHAKDEGQNQHSPLNSSVDGGVSTANEPGHLPKSDTDSVTPQILDAGTPIITLEPAEIADRMVTNGEEFVCFAIGGKSPEEAAMERFMKLTGLERTVAEEAFEPEIVETQTNGIGKTKAKMKVKEVTPVPNDTTEDNSAKEGSDAGTDPELDLEE